MSFTQRASACPICGAAHTACTTDSGPITVVQLPARDAMTTATGTSVVEVQKDTLVAPASTGTYRGPKGPRT